MDQSELATELHKYWQDVVKECKTKRDATPNVIRKNSNLVIKDKFKFARMYDELIHSGKFTENLVKLEFSYGPAIKDMFKTRDSSLEEVQNRSSKEIDQAVNQLGLTHTEATISCLSSRHCQDMERLLNNWNLSIEALKDAQREDFCEKIESFYNNLVSKHDSVENISIGTGPSSISSDVSSSFQDLTLEAAYPIVKEESFTINLGSQLKTAHNLRLLAVDSLHLCDTQRNRSVQMRIHTAMSLYSHDLSALVLLVDNQFNSYHGIQHEFAQMCNISNEFHFDNFSKQIKEIQEKVLPECAGRRSLETGDCYVTKHSNLSNVHVVFHLVTDDSLRNNELNSRHPLLASLRNILRVAHMYDIRTISIPLLLVDEMNEEILTVNWCLKRAELVLKCVKGFLIEMASLSTGVEQGTIQFLVPKGISEDLFSSLASLILEIFRLANSLVLKTSNP